MIEPVTVLLTAAFTLTIGMLVLTTITSLLNRRSIIKAQQHLEIQDKTAAQTLGLVDTRLSAALAELAQSRAATVAVSAKLDLALAKIIALQAQIDGNPGSANTHAIQADAILAAAQLAAAHLTATAQIAADKVLADATHQPSAHDPMPVTIISPTPLDVRVRDDATPPTDPEDAPAHA